jgi:opine dehydrogenase
MELDTRPRQHLEVCLSKVITILGASHGGQALAASLALRGCEIHLYDHPDFKANIDGILQRQNQIELVDAIAGVGQIALATTDIRAAMAGAEIVLVIVPSFAQRIMLDCAAPYLKDDQIILLLPGNFGSLEIANALDRAGCRARVKLAETNSLPFACRRNESGQVAVFGVKEFIEIATFPAADTPDVIDILRDYFPVPLVPTRNVLATAFANFNMLVHCPAAVLNAGWIESAHGNFDFYGEGLSESVCRIVERMDEERRRIGAAFGLDLIPFVEWWQRAYPTPTQSKRLRDIILASTIHSGRGATAPKHLRERYIAEDVPYLLVPLAALGNLVGVATPITEAIITLASALNETDYQSHGRNLEQMGLAGMSAEQIVNYVNHGVGRD